MSSMSEAEMARIREWSRHYTDAIRVRCPRCGESAVSDPRAVRRAVEAEYEAIDVTCGKCGHTYEVDVEVEVTLVSPPREGGEGR